MTYKIAPSSGTAGEFRGHFSYITFWENIATHWLEIVRIRTRNTTWIKLDIILADVTREMDCSRSHEITYAKQVITSRKRCENETWLLIGSNIIMTYVMVLFRRPWVTFKIILTIANLLLQSVEGRRWFEGSKLEMRVLFSLVNVYMQLINVY